MPVAILYRYITYMFSCFLRSVVLAHQLCLGRRQLVQMAVVSMLSSVAGMTGRCFHYDMCVIACCVMRFVVVFCFVSGVGKSQVHSILCAS